MNIAEAFAQYMEDQGYGTLGTNLQIGGVSLSAPDECWWVVFEGGSSIIKNQTGEKLKRYNLDVFFRSRNGSTVYDTLHDFEQTINSLSCIELEDFDVIEVEATSFPTDRDLDDVDRTIGLVKISLTTYYQ